MSKDFEQAYKELAQNEIPDLWDRIEAGLKEKSAPEQKIEEPKKLPAENPGEKKKKSFPFKRYAALAAAVVCAAVIIPAFFNITRTKGGAFSGAADRRGMEEAYDTAAATECAPEEDADTAQELETDEPKSESAGEGGADSEQKKLNREQEAAAGEAEEAADQDNGADAPAAENASGKTDKSKEAMSEAAQSSAQDLQGTRELEDGMALSLTVEVTEEAQGEEGDLSLGTLFTAIIQEDASGLFEEGEELEIYVPVYSSQMLETGKVFSVEIVFKSGERYPFWLKLCKTILEE